MVPYACARVRARTRTAQRGETDRECGYACECSCVRDVHDRAADADQGPFADVAPVQHNLARQQTRARECKCAQVRGGKKEQAHVNLATTDNR
jgi:hypothetical protein